MRGWLLLAGRSYLKDISQVHWLDGVGTMAWRPPEQCFQNEGAICFHIGVLLDQMKISLEHRVSLAGIVHQKK